MPSTTKFVGGFPNITSASGLTAPQPKRKVGSEQCAHGAKYRKIGDTGDTRGFCESYEATMMTTTTKDGEIGENRESAGVLWEKFQLTVSRSDYVQQNQPARPLKVAVEDNRPAGWDKFPVHKRWEVKPNLRAREVVNIYTYRAQEEIEQEINEPEYVMRDAEIRDAVWQIMNQMERFTHKFFRFKYSPKENMVPQTWFEKLTPQTAKIIGCAASGGPGGIHGWHNLFIDEQKRQALCCAIIGNVLVEQVFKHIFFGGTEKDIESMVALSKKYRNENGFDQNVHFAVAIEKVLGRPIASRKSFGLPANFSNHVNHIVAAIWTHLSPFFHLDPQYADSTELHSGISDRMFEPLYEIVTQAGILNLQMRIDAHTVYYFQPIFKDSQFKQERMECFNSRNMAQRRPRLTSQEYESLKPEEKQRRDNLSDAEKERAKYDQPLTQITIMDALCAYRIGGWERAGSQVAKPQYESPQYSLQGIRERILTHAWVYCRWGRARGFKDGKASNGDKKVHGDAWKGGFKEFTDVKGVSSGREKKQVF